MDSFGQEFKVEKSEEGFLDSEVLEEGLGAGEIEEDEMDTDIMDEDEEEEVKTRGVFKLTRPLQGGDEVIKDIYYDFENVTPIQYINLCKKMGKKENITVPELNQNVQFTVFCRAAGIPVSVLKKVKCLQDFTAMCQIARDFLLSKQGESEDFL